LAVAQQGCLIPRTVGVRHLSLDRERIAAHRTMAVNEYRFAFEVEANGRRLSVLVSVEALGRRLSAITEDVHRARLEVLTGVTGVQRKVGVERLGLTYRDPLPRSADVGRKQEFHLRQRLLAAIDL